MEKIPCTIGILTRNNEKTLPLALESASHFAEIIVCDGGSTDRTLELARAAGARIIVQDAAFLDADGRPSDFSGIRNQMWEASTQPWFFYLDSDEYCSDALLQNIRRKAAQTATGAFWLLRRYVWQGKEITCSTTYPNLSMRLVARACATGFIKRVHERYKLTEGTTVGMLDGALFVPLGDGRGPSRQKGDYYIALQVKETLSSDRSFLKLYGATLWRSAAVSAHYLYRLLRNAVFCRGTRMPLSFEWERHRYHLALLAALWRARHTR